MDCLRILSVDASEVYAAHLGHAEQLVDPTFHSATRRCHELEVGIGQRRIDPHLLELGNRPWLIVRQSHMSQHDPGGCIDPECVVNATEAHAHGEHPHRMSTKFGSGIDLPAASPGDFVLDRIADRQYTEKVSARVEEQPDVRVLEGCLIDGKFGDSRWVSDPSSATIPYIDSALGFDVPSVRWGDDDAKVLVGRLFRGTARRRVWPWRR